MNCVVTAGPTYEPLDEVRRLINFSTGRLGSELSNYLVSQGHRVALLRGHQATWCGPCHAQEILPFTTTSDLRERLSFVAKGPVQAVFHAAAVSDFAFGKVWRRGENGQLEDMLAGKLSSRAGPLLAELVATPKIIAELRGWFPRAFLVGWKYEVDGDRAGAIAQAEEQLSSSRTDACVANGRGYGPGFGVITGAGRCAHLEDSRQLFTALVEMMEARAT